MDQAIVSGTSFVTAIMVGRYCGADELGFYSLVLSLLLLGNAAQLSLVCGPLTVFRLRGGADQSPENRAASAATGAVILAMILLGISIVGSVGITLASESATTIAAAWVLTLSLPGFLARDFARRFDFARLHMKGALVFDATVSAAQLAVLFWLATNEYLTGSMTILMIAIVSVLTSVFWLLLRLDQFDFQAEQVSATIRHDWRFGRWLLADNLVCITQLYAMHWMLTAMIGTEAAGVFAACLSIAALANPFLMGVGNYLSPKIAETVSAGSRQKTMKLYWRCTAGLVSVVLLFTVVLFLFGGHLLRILYDGSIDAAYGPVVALLALRMMCSATTIAADHAVIAMESPRGSALVSIAGVVATVAIAFPLIRMDGIRGAAIALVIGTAAESLALIAVFVFKLKRWHWVAPSN
ncbi:lipopolysaccharide biosynthesis protein [Aporhodopirellula aestuarii]|nr:hypothetical protein [Aporhodopirellula aestuarii]